MAALVSESWASEFGGGLDDWGYRPPNRQARLTRTTRTPLRLVNPWLADQNNAATGGAGVNTSTATSTNNGRYRRNRNNASQPAPDTTQNASQPQGRNRNRNRNRNKNRGAQQAGGEAQIANSPEGPSHGRRPGQNNRGGRRPNQPNTDASENLTIDPITGEAISKRAAKRRRAKARKAARANATEQASAQQPRTQPQPSAPVNQTATSSTTPVRARPVPPVLPVISVPPVPLTRRAAIQTSLQPERISTTTARPVISANPTTSDGATPSTSRLSVNHEPSGRENTLHRWRQFIHQDVTQTVRPANSAVGSNINPPLRPGAPVRQTPVATPVLPASRTLPNFGLQPGRTGTTAVPPVPARTRFLWDSDSDDGILRRAQASRNAPVPATPVAPALGGARRLPTAGPSRLAPTRPRPTTPCLICFDIPDEFPQQRPTARCTHTTSICAPCLEQHISHSVLSQGSTTLTCPNPSCRQSMEYADVIRATKGAKACRDRYETLLLRRTLEAEPNFVWCKNTSCNWGQVHESGANAPIVICQVCRARSCFTHDVPWHTGQTCAQYAAQHVNRERENQASETYIAQHAKRCPNPTCGRRIEKSEGCDHMTCRRPVGCGHEFCWVCMADYRPILQDGNHRHNPTCRYYAPILPQPRRLTIEDYWREHRNINPPPFRPEPRVQARPEPAVPVRPRQEARNEGAPAAGGGSLLGWLVGAAFAGWLFRG